MAKRKREQIGRLLFLARQEAQLSQAEVAARAGTTRQAVYLSEYAYDDQVLHRNARAIAKALGCRIKLSLVPLGERS